MKKDIYANNIVSVAVIIPTIGNEIIFETVNMLNSGTLLPNEIIISIPVEYAKSISSLDIIHKNVRILQTSVKGQVAQRAEGFKNAVSDIVIQLDDDILLDPNALKILVDALRMLGTCNVVAPVMLDKKNKYPFHTVKSGLTGFFHNIFFTLICGAKWGRLRIGTISSAGIGFGVGKYSGNDEIVKVEWLPGGCVASYRINLITDDFFPFSGKAFYEDFIHSHLRNMADYKHWIIINATCSTSSSERLLDRESFDKNREARRYYVKMRGLPKLRLLIYEFVEWIKFLLISKIF